MRFSQTSESARARACEEVFKRKIPRKKKESEEARARESVKLFPLHPLSLSHLRFLPARKFKKKNFPPLLFSPEEEWEGASSASAASSRPPTFGYRAAGASSREVNFVVDFLDFLEGGEERKKRNSLFFSQLQKKKRRLPLRLRLDGRRLDGGPGTDQRLCGRGLLLRDEQRRAVGHCVRSFSPEVFLRPFAFFVGEPRKKNKKLNFSLKKKQQRRQRHARQRRRPPQQGRLLRRRFPADVHLLGGAECLVRLQRVSNFESFDLFSLGAFFVFLSPRLSQTFYALSFTSPFPFSFEHSGPYGGGAIYDTSASLIVCNCTFVGNTAADGGALTVKKRFFHFSLSFFSLLAAHFPFPLSLSLSLSLSFFSLLSFPPPPPPPPTAAR